MLSTKTNRKEQKFIDLRLKMKWQKWQIAFTQSFQFILIGCPLQYLQYHS